MDKLAATRLRQADCVALETMAQTRGWELLRDNLMSNCVNAYDTLISDGCSERKYSDARSYINVCKTVFSMVGDSKLLKQKLTKDINKLLN